MKTDLTIRESMIRLMEEEKELMPITENCRGWNDGLQRAIEIVNQHANYSSDKIYSRALTEIKSALNSGRSSEEILHYIGNEVSWALSFLENTSEYSVTEVNENNSK